MRAVAAGTKVALLSEFKRAGRNAVRKDRGGEVERENTEQMYLFSMGKDGVGGERSCLKLAW